MSLEVCHAAQQFGEHSAIESICRNDNDNYFGAVGKPVYVYFYNGNESDDIDIAIDGNINGEFLLDYDDTLLLDYNDFRLKDNL